MKNLVICTVFTGLLALTAAADTSYFYWGVNAGSKYTFHYATIKAAGTDASSGYLSLYAAGINEAFTKLNVADYPTAKGTTAGPIFAGLDGYTGSKFLVELWSESSDTANATPTLVAWQSVDYSKVSSNGSIYNDMSLSGNNAYIFADFVPEPTGGLLVLLGTAALALRRKQNVA